jgi:capsular polysaccharide transport system permease protein
MTTKLQAARFRIRRPAFPAAEPTAPAAVAESAGALFDDEADDGFGAGRFATADGAAETAAAAAGGAAGVTVMPQPADPAPDAIDAIRREGLTGRQLRLARRVALKHNLPATSDFDAVRLLRQAGIDPFQRGSMLELVLPDAAAPPPGRALTTTADPDQGPQLPQAFRPVQVPSTEARAEVNHVGEVLKMQADLMRRRRRKSAMLTARLLFFVGLPTLLCAWYFYVVATPLYATRSEFVIQQSANPTAPAGGLGGLFQGSPFATAQDSIAVQGYLQSREAMQRLDADHGFVAHFADPAIDPIRRLAPDATAEDAYKTYKRNVLISYDPTEGIIKMEVIAADPAKAAAFATALIGYAEGQVDQLTQRLRGQQMTDARASYEEAEANMLASQRRVVDLQEQFKVLSSEVEVQLITAQITQLETLLTQDKLSLEQMRANANPNQSRMDPIIRRIATLESEIAALRAKLTEDTAAGQSLAKVQGELLVAQADVQTRQLLLAQSLQSMETARIEANRQVRYLSLSVSPVQPDEATYPRAFESTVVALLVFAGIYLMLSMTAAILREQITG